MVSHGLVRLRQYVGRGGSRGESRDFLLKLRFELVSAWAAAKFARLMIATATKGGTNSGAELDKACSV
jgi:hypothetical protein